MTGPTAPNEAEAIAAWNTRTPTPDAVNADKAHDWRTDDCRVMGNHHADPVEQLAFELSFELEVAELDAHDLVTVNREKLRTIAKRVLARTKDTPAPDKALMPEAALVEISLREAATDLLRAALAATNAVQVEADRSGTGAFSIDERDNDMLIAERDWQFGWRCIARRPKLVTNTEWRPTAERIVSALKANGDAS
jgi:hypothetical protein